MLLSVMLCMSLSYIFFFFKQKTAYEMRISDWSSDVCSSDLAGDEIAHRLAPRFGVRRRGERVGEDVGQDDARRRAIVEDLARPRHRRFRFGKARHVLRVASEQHGHRVARPDGIALLVMIEARRHEIGRGHVLTPLTNVHLVCRLWL